MLASKPKGGIPLWQRLPIRRAWRDTGTRYMFLQSVRWAPETAAFNAWYYTALLACSIDSPLPGTRSE
ncbi:hypothetical protein PC122_g4723 [Phytophthora cactorum]|nr:hypothetical protein PC122_g4723 [Phytophthora cactorum]